MAWQNGVQQGNNNWCNGQPDYSNYAAFGFPIPGAPPNVTGATQQAWGNYYNAYNYGQNWTAGGYLGTAQSVNAPAPPQGENKKDASLDLTKFQPPLPLELPPPPPPPEEPDDAEKEKKKDSTKVKASKDKDESSTKASEPKEKTKSVTTTSTPSSTATTTTTATTPYFYPHQFSHPPPFPTPFQMYGYPYWQNNYQNQPNNSPNTSGTNKVNQPFPAPIKFNIGKKPNLTPSSLSQDNKNQNENISAKNNSFLFNQGNSSSNDNLKDSNKNKTDQVKCYWIKGSETPVNKMPFVKNTNASNQGFFSQNKNQANISKDFENKEWPPALKKYICKCLSACVMDIDKDHVELCLKGKITKAAREGTIWDYNWDKEPLINVISKNQFGNERKGKIEMKEVGGDKSRGFTLVKRSRSRSPTRSDSTSPVFDLRRRKDWRREEPSDNSGFISFNNKKGRGGFRGRGKNRGRGRGGYVNNEEKSSGFYSKGGAAMDLDAELKTDERLEKRAARFASMMKPQKGGNAARGRPAKKRQLQLSLNSFTVDNDNMDWTSIHVVGTCTTLQKQYLRLTSAPDPSTVRTLPTLRKALELAKKEWAKNKDYRVACDQLKSIRQDLTIQGIRDEFTVLVYETHCRIALEKGDHEEFNQCQTQLRDLYHEIGGKNIQEFSAYRLLYHIFTKSTLDMTSMLAGFTKNDKQHECIKFALELRAAWSLSNYHRFFKLYKNAPQMSGFLIDWFVSRERTKAIKIIIKSYRPGNISSDFVKSTLALNEQDWTAFVEEFNLVFTDAAKKFISCKQTVIAT